MIRDHSIICFGGEDWWYHHPHHSEHLLRRFARAGNTVIFVNSISMGLPSLVHKDILPRVRRKLASYARLARTTDDGITVVSPVTLPFYGSRLSRFINEGLLRLQVGGLARARGMRRPILWVAIPTAIGVAGRLDESLIIYLVSDKYDANTMDHDTDPTQIRLLHERALDSADLILYSGRRMFDEATRARTRSHLLEHGIDYEHFAQSQTLTIAPEIARIPAPRLGYFGALEDWLIDEDLIEHIALKRPEYHWVFVGNCARGMRIGELPNVHILPAVPYAELPRYAAGFDVCVLPWQTGGAWAAYAAPMKVREYLATGKPTVIMKLYEFEQMRDVLRIADDKHEFLRHIEDALAERGEDAKMRRQASVADLTWDAQAARVNHLIEEALISREARES